MVDGIDVKNLSRKIDSLKELAEDLQKSGNRFPALRSNMNRILASIKMLEINICDLAETEEANS